MAGGRARRWLAGVGGFVACLVALMATAPSVLASADVNFGAGMPVALPQNAASPPTSDLAIVSCSSPGNCTAVGGYSDSPSNPQVLLLVTEANGIWSAGVQPTLPGGADANGNLSIGAISCTAPGDCTAVGAYTDSSFHPQGLLLTETSGVWAPGVEASLPANAGSNPNVQLNSVSCVAPGSCTAVGDYADGSGDAHAVILTETSGTWGTGVEPVFPATGPTQPQALLNVVSCPSAGNCSAAGTYLPSVGLNHVLLLSETNGVWGAAVDGPPPAGAQPGANLLLGQLSCGSPGDCALVGTYFDSSSHTLGMLFDETSGTWSAGMTAPLPASAVTGSQESLISISCPAAGSCSASGFYTASSDRPFGLVLTETDGNWGSAVPVALPANAGNNPQNAFPSISCASPGDCVAGGSYLDSSGNQQGVVVTQSDGIWSSGVEVTPPPDAASNPDVNGLGVSCASVGSCAAVGDYDNSSGEQAFVINATPEDPALSLTAPSTGVAGAPISPSSVSGQLSGGLAPVGTVTFTVFGPQSSPPASCTSGGAQVGSATVSGNGTYNPAAGFTPIGGGDYWWYASYGGDASDTAAASPCGPLMSETVVTGRPFSISPPTISGTDVAGRTLTEAHGVWSNDPTAYSYQWERCNRRGGSCMAITGATLRTYKLRSSDAGHRIRVDETAANAAGSATVTSAPTAVVSARDRA